MIILNDFSTSVRKALEEIDPNYDSYEALVVCGTHTPQNTNEMIDAIKIAREKNVPFLGICFGFQLMIIEYARNVLGIKDATSEEFGEGSKVISKLPKMRVGIFPFYYRDGLSDSTINGLGEATTTYKEMESFWHNYAVNPDYITALQEHLDLRYSNDIVAYAGLLGHPHFIGVQFHPEYQSSKDKPHPILKNFLNICK